MFWEAIELSFSRVWFVVTVGHFAKNRSMGAIQMEQVASTNVLISGSHKVVSLLNDQSETDKVLSVQAMIPPEQSDSPDWEMRRVLAIWRYQPPVGNASDEIPYPYDAVEVEGGDLVPSASIGEPVNRARLSLVVRLSTEASS